MPMGQFTALYSQMEEVLLLYYMPFCTCIKEQLGYPDVFPFKLDRNFKVTANHIGAT